MKIASPILASAWAACLRAGLLLAPPPPAAALSSKAPEVVELLQAGQAQAAAHALGGGAGASVSAGQDGAALSYAIYGSVGTVLVLGAGIAAYAADQKKDSDLAEPLEGGTELGEGVEEPKPRVDVERLVKLVAKRAAQSVGPKCAKANQVRGVLEKRVVSLKKKASEFIWDEVRATTASVLKEVEAEEMMLLLDPDSSTISHLPPASILLAGSLSPVILTVSIIIHVSQVLMVFLPVLLMCGVSVYIDFDTLNGCGVPTIWYWVYVQGLLATILTIAHLATSAQIRSGQASIKEKLASMKGRLKEAVGDGDLTLDEVRELFIIFTILLEHSLIVEDGLRRSPWRAIIGYGTLLWIATTAWTFVLVLGWTFVPGMIAFHADAASVAGDRFCGAWASVFSARLTCVLSLLFLMVNLLSVVQFFSDQLVLSDAYATSLLTQAKKFDDSSLGIPAAQTIVKAFLLRGTADTLQAQIAASKNKDRNLEKERDDLQRTIESLSGRIRVHRDEAEALKKDMGIADEASAEDNWAQNMSFGLSQQGADLAEGLSQTGAALTQSGAEFADQASAQAAALQVATQKEIEELYKKMMDTANQLRNSGMLQDALAQAQQAADSASSSMDAQALTAAMGQAQEAAQQAAQQATEQTAEESSSRCTQA